MLHINYKLLIKLKNLLWLIIGFDNFNIQWKKNSLFALKSIM